MLNVFLVKFWIFDIDFSTIISFLVGVMIGFILLLLIYALLVVSSMRSKDFITKTEKDDLTTQEVKDMVLEAQASYKNKELRKDSSRLNYCYKLGKDLAYNIAARYFPKSKNPLMELSVNELTILMTYITGRVDEILNRKAIRILRQAKLITIVELSNKAKEIEKSETFKNTVKAGKVATKIKNVVSIINPLNWGRRLIVDRIINLIVDKICIVIISIIGEETYKIYSKKVFNKEVEIDTNVDDEIEDLSASIKEVAESIDVEIPNEPAPKKRLKSKIVRFETHEASYITYNSHMPLLRKVDKSNEKEESNSN